MTSKKGKKTRIIYIAGPITEDEDYRQKFREAQRYLEKQGYIVFNPTIMPEGLVREAYLPICYKMLDACDSIYLLKGWQYSEGARKEWEYATQKEKNILFREWTEL